VTTKVKIHRQNNRHRKHNVLLSIFGTPFIVSKKNWLYL